MDCKCSEEGVAYGNNIRFNPNVPLTEEMHVIYDLREKIYSDYRDREDLCSYLLLGRELV